jgi:hypothetical protein
MVGACSSASCAGGSDSQNLEFRCLVGISASLVGKQGVAAAVTVLSASCGSFYT